MKIRTRLLLFLIPILVGNVAFVLALHKFQHNLPLVILGAGLSVAFMLATLFIISNKISKPIQKLNHFALAIAAGQYGEAAEPTGPREIAELANTLNTMSECLLENINRLKENSLLRERMYGEYESAVLFQHFLLQRNIDDCRSDAIAVKAISHFSDYPCGILLSFPKPEKEQFAIHLAEAEETGFEGMYELLTQYKHSSEFPKQTSLLFDCNTGSLHHTGSHFPLFYSLENHQFLDASDGKIKLECGDFFFLFNHGLLEFFKTPHAVQNLLGKVLKVFAQDGLEKTAAILQKELAFASRKQDPEKDLHLLCFQILSN